jgi:hypothetical protein
LWCVAWLDAGAAGVMTDFARAQRLILSVVTDIKTL